MSCDDDWGDVWEPIINVVEENKLVDIPITAITGDDLKTIEEAATSALEQKLCKLNIVLKNLNVYIRDNKILVNDRYGICEDIEEIVHAFSMSIEPITCSLRGKSYVITDKLVALITTINPDYVIEDIANQKLTSELTTYLDKIGGDELDLSLAKILRSIRMTGKYSIIGTQKVVSTYEDGKLIDKTEGDIISDERNVTERLKTYLNETSASLVRTNESLRDGTAKLLYSRARQMGYAVKEERKGNKIQLVLVRCE